jgi:cytochrome c biogenesis protein
LEPVYQFLRSRKLAVVLILYLAVASALSTLVPQGKDPAYYRIHYSPVVERLLESTSFHRFFKSPLFLVPLFVFSVSLLICTVERLAIRFKKRTQKRFGPDIIHIGILVLMIGGIIRVYGRTESMVYLAEGETARLSNGYEILLNSFEYLKYEDGRPKDWFSNVTLLRNDSPANTFTIEVNRPLRVGKLKLYQSSFSQDSTADLRDPDGKIVTVRPGDYYMRADSIIVFRRVDAVQGSGFVDGDNRCLKEGYAVFDELANPTSGEGHRLIAVHQVAVSEKIDDFTVEKVCAWNRTGLQIVKDPSMPVVIAAFILIGMGVSLAFIQRIGENET